MNGLTNRVLVPLTRAVGDLLARRRGRANRLYIVNYHRILEARDPLLLSEPDLEEFRWQMELLARGFNVLALADAMAALAERRLPPRAVCITFDDGYRSTHDLALPILTALGLPATVFVATGYLDGGNMWNDRIVEAVRHLPAGLLDLRDSGFGVHRVESSRDRGRVADNLTNASKYLAPAARQAFAHGMELRAGITDPVRLMLTADMVRSLVHRGIEVGGHTVSHPILSRLDDASARAEIAENKRELESITEGPVRFFAYPNGKPGIDFNESHARMVRELGYAAAFSTMGGAVSDEADQFSLPRGRPRGANPWIFSARLLHWLTGPPAAPRAHCDCL